MYETLYHIGFSRYPRGRKRNSSIRKESAGDEPLSDGNVSTSRLDTTQYLEVGD